MMDLVINHTSIEHPWFLESRSSIDNPKRDWYIWRDGKNGREPNNWASHFMNSVWELDKKTNQYYFHMFAREQADLNWKNKEVKKEIFSMVEFWLEKGVDAFRMDMANYLMKAEGFPDAPRKKGDDRKYIHGEGLYANQAGMHELINELKEKVLAPYGAALFGETYFLNKNSALEYVAYNRKECYRMIAFGTGLARYQSDQLRMVRLCPYRPMAKWLRLVHLVYVMDFCSSNSCCAETACLWVIYTRRFQQPGML